MLIQKIKPEIIHWNHHSSMTAEATKKGENEEKKNVTRLLISYFVLPFFVYVFGYSC